MITQTVPTDIMFSSARPYDARLGNFTKFIPALRSTHDLAQILKSVSKAYVICGYPDDEGIRLNNGRPGAAEGPDCIRKYLYRMTPNDLPYSKKIIDIGNILLPANLSDRHELGSTLSQTSHTHKQRWISLGGGHDYAYADGAAFLRSYAKSKTKPLIINFDAHLDVRVLDTGFNSGTPFRRLLEEFKKFDFAEVGIQALCNNPDYVEWVEEKGAKIVWADEILSDPKNMLNTFQKKFKPWLKRNRPTFVSVDIDGFSSAFAPGCSQSWPTGFTPKDFFNVLTFLQKTLDIRALGIYEVSPPLDVQNQTAKLAAEIAYRFIHGH